MFDDFVSLLVFGPLGMKLIKESASEAKVFLAVSGWWILLLLAALLSL